MNLTNKIANPYDATSFSARARQRRWDKFMGTFPDLAEMRVLDIGGVPRFWRSAPVRPVHVTTVNLEDPNKDLTEPWIERVIGDACEYQPTMEYDLVISNSVIEHVGGHHRRQQLADVIHAAAPRHWVQTPYRYFPVEPHYLAPGLQLLPAAAQAAAVRRWPLGYVHRDGRGASVAAALDIELLSITQMRHYFPQSELWYERLAGLVKSIVAIKTG